MGERYKVSSAVYVLLERGASDDSAQKELLLMRRAGTGYMDGFYGLIAGHLDPDESLKHAAAREADEEAGITINESDLTFAHVLHTAPETPGDHSDQRTDFYFKAANYTGIPKIMETDKCDDMRWFPDDQLPPNMVPRVAEAIHNIRKGRMFAESGWPETN